MKRIEIEKVRRPSYWVEGSGKFHPARFSWEIVDVMAMILADEIVGRRLTIPGYDFAILDPFAGTGEKVQLHPIYRLAQWSGYEIERDSIMVEWIIAWDATVRRLADALSKDGMFVSPTYGNRFADHHKAQDGSLRRSYTHDLRRKTGNPNYSLNENNTGLYKFGSPRYRELHVAAWRSTYDAMKPGAIAVVNVSDFIERVERRVEVVEWHRGTLIDVGWQYHGSIEVGTPRLTMGENRKRADGEVVMLFRKPGAFENLGFPILREDEPCIEDASVRYVLGLVDDTTDAPF